MHDTIVFYTFVALILFFLAIELYKLKYNIKGQVLGFCRSESGLENFAGSRMKVELKNGTIVEAEAETCTMCMGEFCVGDEVRLIKSKDKYFVHLSLFLPKQKACKYQN